MLFILYIFSIDDLILQFTVIIAIEVDIWNSPKIQQI